MLFALTPVLALLQTAPAGLNGKTTITPSDGAMLQSSSGDYRAKCQTDGNFCVYQVLADGTEQLKYCSGTANRDIGSCVFEDDGNFVLLDSNGDPYWTTKDNPREDACNAPSTDYYAPHALNMQDDGNLQRQARRMHVVLRHCPRASCSSTGGRECVRFLQLNSNIVPGKHGAPSNSADRLQRCTRCAPSCVLRMPRDGEALYFCTVCRC